jgi:hypothetical protein
MAQTAQEIADAIYQHLSGRTDFAKFYIGITNDIERRLFGEHNVSKEQGTQWWIYKKAIDAKDARAVEQHFLDKGMKGGSGGGDDNSVFVYCYEITKDTEE